MDISQIAFKFFRECKYPDQIADMARDHLPQWLTLHEVPVEQHEEAIALIQAIAKWLTLHEVPVEQHEEAIALIQAIAKELLKTRGYQ